MGSVYAAYDPVLRRPVAIKILHRGDGVSLARLLREARALARLSHPNVVPVFDVGRCPSVSDPRLETAFLVMRRIEGENLKVWLHAPRSAAAILRAFVGAGRGLAAAHRAGVVHRDVKPANILLGRDGEAVVVDFGLARNPGPHSAPVARSLERITQSGRVVGTPAYMSPEQRAGGPVDAASDQYSFCASLLEALSGPARARRGWSHVPAELRAVLQRGVSARPEHRFADMHALLAALEPAGTVDAAPPRRRRAVGPILLGAATVLVTVPAAGGDSRCAHLRAHMDAAWSDTTRSEVGASFRRRQAPYAAAMWRAVEPRVDVYAARWRTVARGVCDGSLRTSVEADRIRCLSARVDDLEDTLAVLSAGATARAADVVAGLPEPEACADAAAPARVRSGPVVRARSVVLRIALETAQADARGRADALLAEAWDLGHAPVLLQAELAAAGAAARRGDRRLASKLRTRVHATAVARDEPLVAARAAVAVARAHAETRGFERDAVAWTRHARVSLERLRVDAPALRAAVVGLEAHALIGSNRPRAAVEKIDVALSEARLDVGAEHPAISGLLQARALALTQQRRFELARAAYVQARIIEVRNGGREHAAVARIDAQLAQLPQGRWVVPARIEPAALSVD